MATDLPYATQETLGDTEDTPRALGRGLAAAPSPQLRSEYDGSIVGCAGTGAL